MVGLLLTLLFVVLKSSYARRKQATGYWLKEPYSSTKESWTPSPASPAKKTSYLWQRWVQSWVNGQC
jgi:hypothetical protein